MCNFRHPKICRYFSELSSCKFSDGCLYLHRSRISNIENYIDSLNKEIEKLKTKNLELEKVLKRLDKETKQDADAQPIVYPRVFTNPSYLFSSSNSTFSATTISTTSCNTSLNPCQIQSSNTIPQLDGAISSSAATQHLVLKSQPCHTIPSDTLYNFQCQHCEKQFKTLEQLQIHDDANQFGCDNCYLCFQSKESADLHELAEHPGSVFALNHIPHATKIKFASLRE